MMPLPVCLKMSGRGYLLIHPSHLATPGWHNGRVAQRKCFHGRMPFLMAHVLGYPAISRMPESKAEGWKPPIEAKKCDIRGSFHSWEFPIRTCF